MNYSRRQLEAFGEPFGDSCTRVEAGRLICGGGGKGGGGGSTNTQTIQKADPWGPVQPFLSESFPWARDWFLSNDPQFFPQGTVAGQAPETLQAQAAMAQRAQAGSPLQSGAQALGFRTLAGDFLGQPSAQLWANPWMQNAADVGMTTLQGGFLGSNPFLDSMYRAASDPLVDQFSRAVAPAITSQFAAGGRYGSGLHEQAVMDAAGQLGRTLGNMGAGLYGTAYDAERARQQQMVGQATSTAAMFQQLEDAERARQMSMIGMAPQLAQLDFNDPAVLAQLGATREQRAQELLNADIARWDFEQNQTLAKLQAYSQLLLGGAGAGGQTSSMTRMPGGGGSPLGGALGGALMGWQMAPMLGGLFGAGAGSAAGMGLGSGLAAGGGLGMTAGGGLGMTAGAGAGGAAGGAATGSSFGPWGALAGAILGGLLG